MRIRNSRNIISFVLLASYLLLAITLDLHHNHSSILPEYSTTPAVSPAEFHNHEHAEPCPVLLFSLSHAPVVAADIQLLSIITPAAEQALTTLTSAVLPKRVSRAPPENV